MVYNSEKDRLESDVFDGVEVPVEEPEDEEWTEYEWKCSQEKCDDAGLPREEITPCVITFKMKGNSIPVPEPKCPYGGEFTLLEE